MRIFTALFLLIGLALSSSAMAAFNVSGYTLPSTGVAAPYFVISKITLNPLNNSIQISTNDYINNTAYTNGLNPVSTQNFTITGATYNAFMAALTASDMAAGTTQGAVVTELLGTLQTNMLTLPFFSGATIVP